MVELVMVLVGLLVLLVSVVVVDEGVLALVSQADPDAVPHCSFRLYREVGWRRSFTFAGTV